MGLFYLCQDCTITAVTWSGRVEAAWWAFRGVGRAENTLPDSRNPELQAAPRSVFATPRRAPRHLFWRPLIAPGVCRDHTSRRVTCPALPPVVAALLIGLFPRDRAGDEADSEARSGDRQESGETARRARQARTVTTECREDRQEGGVLLRDTSQGIGVIERGGDETT